MKFNNGFSYHHSYNVYFGTLVNKYPMSHITKKLHIPYSQVKEVDLK